MNGRFATMPRERGFVTGVLAVGALLATSGASADPLDDLRQAVLAFRGIGLRDVAAYRATFRLPDEEQQNEVRLEELWRAPSTFAIRAADGAPAAVVRSYAIFLEPLYVARASILDADLEAGAERLRQVARLQSTPGESGARTIRLTLPAQPDSTLPGFFRDVSWLEGRLRADGKLLGFHVEFRASEGRVAETLDLTCTWKDVKAPQPSLCTWTLPDGGVVRVTTSFRVEHGRRVPASRHVTFPSRYDPGESEEIRIEYGPYSIEVPAGLLEAPGSFRYGAGGLVSD